MFSLSELLTGSMCADKIPESAHGFRLSSEVSCKRAASPEEREECA